MHFQNSPHYAQELWVGLIYTYNHLTAVNVFVSSTWPKCWMRGELHQHCAADVERRAGSFSASKKQQLVDSEETVGRRIAEYLSTCAQGPCLALASPSGLLSQVVQDISPTCPVVVYLTSRLYFTCMRL